MYEKTDLYYTALLKDCAAKLQNASYDSIIAQLFLDDWNYHIWAKHYQQGSPFLKFLEHRINLLEAEKSLRDMRSPEHVGERNFTGLV